MNVVKVRDVCIGIKNTARHTCHGKKELFLSEHGNISWHTAASGDDPASRFQREIGARSKIMAEHRDRATTTRLPVLHFCKPVAGAPTEIYAGFDFDVRILDPATGLLLWYWEWTVCGRGDEWTLAMIPADRAALFPSIVHPCDTVKEVEYQFLEIS